MTGTHHAWTGRCTRCRERVTVDIIALGHTVQADLDPTRFVCLPCRDPRHARQLQLDERPEPDVFNLGRHETIPYPPDMVEIPL